MQTCDFMQAAWWKAVGLDRIAKSIEGAGMCVQDGILKGAQELAAKLDAACRETTAERIAADYKTTQMAVEAVLSGCKYVEQGLHHIANELSRSNVLTERNGLERQIHELEEWLFDKGFLREFYETTNIEGEFIPFVNASYYYFLNAVYIPRMKVDEKEDFRKIKGEAAQSELERITLQSKESLKALAKRMKCHPIIVLAYMLFKNKLELYERPDACIFRIAHTTYTIKASWVVSGFDDIKNLSEQEMEVLFGEQRLVFKLKTKSTDIYKKTWELEMKSFQEALDFLFQVAMKYESVYGEGFCVTPPEWLEWGEFFDQLNMTIAMYNLRVLKQRLEKFQRDKRLAG